MDILIVMALGIAVGRWLFPDGYQIWIARLQVLTTALLIFSMGVMLGQRENFLRELAEVGWTSLLFCIFPIFFSLVIVYWLTDRFMENTQEEKTRKAVIRILRNAVQKMQEEDGRGQQEVPMEESNYMVLIALAALCGGTICGLTGAVGVVTSFLVQYKTIILYLLMFFVGISTGMHRGIFKEIREYHVKILLIPAGIVVGSLLGGLLTALLIHFPMRESLAIASGMGWYSLAGVTIGNLAGAKMGSIAFLSNLMREILSFFMIPWIARHLNDYSCIAPAGATSEDTTLAMIVQHTGRGTAVLAVVNGMICSSLVPVLISLIFS